ncbi:hypothetical protein DQ04_02171020 [Trypanosoma grayi]|uniref:hypothetical protein n=1 Tax=Trypanosoma grayi TaxID=71804 RepID=UPI0004F40514|nr:hypothetical protein DQ04_02171020 [Trypanosoma grayi]KEG11895.1 hypothetical protein DQ04_02171020 [Trypanosoma grayi]
MRALTPVWRSATTSSSSATFDLIGRVPLRSRPRYSQQMSATQKVMDGGTLAALPAAPLRYPRHATQQALLELEEQEQQQQKPSDALCLAAETVDDDIMLDDLHNTPLCEVAALSERKKLCEHHPAARGVGADVIDLVTDAFKVERERLIAQRRRVLYDLTHPRPSDYTYKGKLVPPPPLSFGTISEEAKMLGNKVMLGQHYSLVKQAGVRRDGADDAAPGSAGAMGQRRRGHRKETMYDNHNYFFEINDLYQEIVLVGKACAGKSSLLNALLGQPVAKTSSTPNTTRQVSFYQSVSPAEMQRYLNVRGNGLVKLPGGGLQLTFVDVPGFGMEGMSDQWRDKAVELTDAYLGVRRSVNTVLFCIDCERGLTKADLRYFTWLENLHGVFFVVLTKCDSVPHSRVCSVMRQIYAVITKNRRKYRKVFPFILPTSAKDGTNVEVLRGLIAETSGLIPGDRLREVLKAKAEADMRAALEEEQKRLQEARHVEVETAKAFFATTKGKAIDDTALPPPAATELLSTPAPTPEAQKFVLHLDGQGDGNKGDRGTPPVTATEAQPSLVLQTDERNDMHETGSDEKKRRRQRFLAWRHARPLQRHTSSYGSFRLNTGLESPDSERLELLYTGTDASKGSANMNSTASDEANDAGHLEEEEERNNKDASANLDTPPPAPAAAVTASAVLGLSGTGGVAEPLQETTGGVSRFLTILNKYAQQETPVRTNQRIQAKEDRWRERLRSGSVTRFLVEEHDGRLAEYKAGKKFGPSVVEPDGVERRRSQWAAQQYVQQAVAVRPTAPWAALDDLRKHNERVKQEAAMKGMSRKDLEAYLRNSGRITEDFEKFEGEVTTAKYMNEIRQTKTLRTQQQMHLNSTAKISYRSMPVGLWKHYGQRNTYWPTSNVKGR